MWQGVASPHPPSPYLPSKPTSVDFFRPWQTAALLRLKPGRRSKIFAGLLLWDWPLLRREENPRAWIRLPSAGGAGSATRGGSRARGCAPATFSAAAIAPGGRPTRRGVGRVGSGVRALRRACTRRACGSGNNGEQARPFFLDRTWVGQHYAHCPSPTVARGPRMNRCGIAANVREDTAEAALDALCKMYSVFRAATSMRVNRRVLLREQIMVSAPQVDEHGRPVRSGPAAMAAGGEWAGVAPDVGVIYVAT